VYNTTPSYSQNNNKAFCAEQAGVGIIFTEQGPKKNALSWSIIATNFPCRDGAHDSK